MARVNSREKKDFGLRIADCGLQISRTPGSLLPAPRSSRRGVLMLVVLSMLVLFMLIGTAFLMTSSQSREAAKHSARLNRLDNHATRRLDRALLLVLRDTDNPHSAIRYHSILRDLYGTDGFQGAIYRPRPAYAGDTVPFDPTVATRFAGATPGNAAQQLGPTQGQFIDIYVRSLGWDSTRGASFDDPLTEEPVKEDQGPHALLQPDARHVVKLERNILDLPQLHALPLTRGYYNGSLLTITSGPAAGQSARIVDYEYIADIEPSDPTNSPPQAFTRLFRFRVMAFPRTDGQPLQINPNRSPEIADLAGVTFIVNGRPFNGTGVGYNPLAATGNPRLTALQLFSLGSDLIGAEVALTPNSAFLDFAKVVMCTDSSPGSPFRSGLTSAEFLWLNDPDTTKVPIANRPQFWKYQSFAGPGDVDESYDAADFQNMFLALLTVSPRTRGRVVHNISDVPLTFEVDDPEIIDRNGNFANTDKFLRLDLEDVPWPSFHRPDLVNYWYHRLFSFMTAPSPAGLGLDPNDSVRAIIHPYGPNSVRESPGDDPAGVPQNVRDFIVAIKRKIMLRPIREDHPNFDGGNPLSVPPNLNDDSVDLAATGQISIPYWEACGPWDVDNDNDGINDSIWVDIGEPVIEAEDGTRYKALYAYLIVDLDSRLNVNAHGLADHVPVPRSAFAANFDPRSLGLARDGVTTVSTDQLPHGLGYGPADISLRPVFPVPWSDVNGTLSPLNNRSEDSDGNGVHDPNFDAPIDSYAALLAGRQRVDRDNVKGKWGFALPSFVPEESAATPGLNYLYVPNPAVRGGEQAIPDLAAQFKFFDYPWTYNWLFGQSLSPSQLLVINVPPSAFGTPPDLMGRYSLGLDHAGQPVYEVAYDPINSTNNTLPRQLLTDSPYELDLSNPQRRDTWAVEFASPTDEFARSLMQSDDAAFATTDLERILRAWDADAGTLPSRLWDVVDVFDPVKLMEFDPHRVTFIASQAFGTLNPSEPERLAAAQQITAINRHLVTTDSVDLPVPAASVPNPDVYAVGADGAPGRAGVDDDGDGQMDQNDLDELNSPVSDDFRSLFGKEAAQATIFDLLRYRVWLEVRKEVMQENGWNEAALTGLSQANYRDQLLIPVSARTEARLNGEPFIDNNGNGVYDTGDTFTPADHDRNGNGVYDPPMAPLLAPELVAGKRMDLNRPFGDGRDNAGDGIDNNLNGDIDEPDEAGDPFVNGVVDDPLEAGEPFLDRNGNGKWDNASVVPPNGEPFIDLDGSNDYTRPRDQMWRGLTMERVGFDHTNGQGEPLHPAVAATLPNLPAGGAKVRNLDSQARQLYARQLYCLMLLLVDQNYIAPWDENDPQIKIYLDIERKKLTDPPISMNAQLADQRVKRKLTCRAIAQWAINCVDARDSDAIMTPFEYDENPWDGWGTLDTTDPNNPVLLPLDGDPATDENKGEFIDWAGVATSRDKQFSNLAALSPARQLPTPPNQTRGVVWGVERPELLITETIAFHDRRAEDAMSPSSNGHDDFSSSGGTRYFDGDLDQGLLPWGRLYVELYNPWSQDGQRPAELYRYHDGTVHTVNNQAHEGVLLQRLTNFAADNNGELSTTTGKRSPVWRIIVVEEWPDSRNVDAADDLVLSQNNPPEKRLVPAFKTPAANSTEKMLVDAYKAMGQRVRTWAGAAPTPQAPAAPFYAANPDFDEVFQLTDAHFLWNPAGTAFTRKRPTRLTPTQLNFDVAYPYIEREFYFTTDNSVTAGATPTALRDVNDPAFKLRIPDRTLLPPSGIGGTWPGDFQTQKFIAPNPDDSDNDYKIAPILPGRYGVVGSAGVKYRDSASVVLPDGIKNSLVTPIGRIVPTGFTVELDTPDDDHLRALAKTRRIVMRPDTNPAPNIFESNPNINQFLVAGNGGFDPRDEPTRPLPQPADLNFPTDRRDQNAFENGRSHELINENGTVRNIHDKNDTDPADAYEPDGIPDSEYYQPCVAIPVEGMSVSEPAWGWEIREWEARQEESQRSPSGLNPSHNFNPNFAYGEGRYASSATGTPGTGFSSASAQFYDVPFDLYRAERNRTGTTPNYRTVHLQRLANPLLPWNPPPGQMRDATGADMHKPNLPINPYRTVDSSTVDLTAFNGVTNEGSYPDEPTGTTEVDQQHEFGQYRPWLASEREPFSGTSYRTHMEAPDPPQNPFSPPSPNILQVWNFQTVERGAWDRLNVAGPPPTPAPPRSIWAQEPAHVALRKRNPKRKLFDGRDLSSMRVPSLAGSPGSDRNYVPTQLATELELQTNRVDMVLEHSLGFANESFGRLYSKQPGVDLAPTTAAAGAPRAYQHTFSTNANGQPLKLDVISTYPWLSCNNRPFVSGKEILQVPAASSAQLLRLYSTFQSNLPPNETPNPYDGDGWTDPTALEDLANLEEENSNQRITRLSRFMAPFGHLLNPFLAAGFSPGIARDATNNPITDPNDPGIDPSDPTVKPFKFIGAPEFYRILEYVHVPSRYVGTETLLNPDVFNDVPGIVDGTAPTVGSDILGASDPRYNFQPPFNQVSRERDPGKVNLNTITGRRISGTWDGNPATWDENDNGSWDPDSPNYETPPQIWSEVFDGIMHRMRDRNSSDQLSHLGPAWRDVVMSRKGYAQVNADGSGPIEKLAPVNNRHFPDVFELGLNPAFPTVIANPFRAPDAGDLVPLQQMMRYGVDASWLRRHHFNRGGGGTWGTRNKDDNKDGAIDDSREAGFAQDELVVGPTGALISPIVASESSIPLFSETFNSPYIDGERNPYFYYQPMARLDNLVTTRSNVFAVWITVGYFEVERAPDWNDPDPAVRASVRARFGDDIALYNRVYPDGYMLGREVGSDTGDVKRARGFYIIDRTEPVGFKPGDDLNVERTIRLRRRIE